MSWSSLRWRNMHQCKPDAMRWRALLWLLLAVAAVAACMVQMQPRIPIETNLLALLPVTERNPVAEHAVNELASSAGNRAVFLVGAKQDTQAIAAARQLAGLLRQSGHFQHVLAEIPPLDPKALGNFYAPFRYRLLSHGDQEQLAQATDIPTLLQARLQEKLYAPFRFGLSLPIADDPFGFADQWLASLPFKSLQLEPDSGMLLRRDADTTWVFVNATLKSSSYDAHLQQQVVNTVQQAETAMQAQYPDTTLLRTGTVFYANAAQAGAESEIHRISIVSLTGMLLLLYLVFRSIRPLALGLLSVGFGISAALAVTMAVFGEVHLITLVFGASLIGEAIDYAIQYFAAHLGAGPDWEPMQGLRRIRAGLTVALITSLMGYAALALAPFPALSQIALFALVGLTSAWLSVFLLLPALLRKPSLRDLNQAVVIPQKILMRWQHKISARNCLIAAGLLTLLAVPGWLQLQANDDVHLLINRPAELVEQENNIRRLIGFDNSSQFILVEDKDAETVLQHEEALQSRLEALIKQGQLTSFQGIASFVPSGKRQAGNHAQWQRVFKDETALTKLMDEAGLHDDIATQQIASFKASTLQPLTVDQWLAHPLSTPFRVLWLGQTTQGYASIVLPQGIQDIKALQAAIEGLPQVTLVDKAGSVSALFQQYRQWSTWWLLLAIGLILLVLKLRYSWQQAAIILMPTILAILLTIALFGYLGIPLTLFNMMSLMLMLGIGINYAIFLREGGVHRAATLAGVLLSAGTTLLSFGMLAFSQMPALASFGLTLLTGIAISAMLAPMLLSFDHQPTGKQETTAVL